MQLGQIQARLRPHAPAAVPGWPSVAADARLGRPRRRLRHRDVVLGRARRARAARRRWSLRARPRRLRLRRPARSRSACSPSTSPGPISRSPGRSRPATRSQGSNQALLYLLRVRAAAGAAVDRRGRAGRAARVRARRRGDRRSCCCSAWPPTTASAALVIDGRLAAPTGYFNSTAALFTIDALVGDRCSPPAASSPGLLRGLLRRLRVLRPAAGADRPEPRLAVHAAARGARGDRGRSRPAAPGGRPRSSRSPAPLCRSTGC